MNIRQEIIRHCNQLADDLRRAVLQGMLEGLQEVQRGHNVLHHPLPIRAARLTPRERAQRPVYQTFQKPAGTQTPQVTQEPTGRFSLTHPDGRVTSSIRRRDVVRQARRWGFQVN